MAVTVTIDGGKVSENLTDFPLLLHLTAARASEIFSALGDNYAGLSITQGGSPCYAEVVKWDASGQDAFLWVKVPSLPAGVNTQVILTAAGGSSAYIGPTGSAAAQNVWTNNYNLVLHLAEQGSGIAGEYKDSTSNQIHGQAVSGETGLPQRDSGPGGYSLRVNRNSHATFPDHPKLSIDSAIDQLTIEAWLSPAVEDFNSDTINGYIGWMTKMAYPDQCEYVGVAYNLHGQGSDGVPRPQWTSIYFLSPTGGAGAGAGGDHGYAAPESWYHITANTDSVWTYGYFNGEKSVTMDDIWSNYGLVYQPGNAPLILGMRYAGSSYNGRIAEFRISNIKRSAGWIRADHNSQADTLVSYSASVTPPDPPANSFGLNEGQTVDQYTEEANRLDAARVVNTAGAGIVSVLEAYMPAAPPGNVRLGLYSDNNNAPGTLLAQGEATPADYNNGWLRVDGLSAEVAAGATYWIVVHLSQPTALYWANDGVLSHQSSALTPYPYASPLPAAWPGVAGDWAGDTPYIVRAILGGGRPMWLPSSATPLHWQWVIGGAFNVNTNVLPNVTIYDIDWELTSAADVAALHALGFKVIAYIEIGDYTDSRYDSAQFVALDNAAGPKILGNQISGFSDRWMDIRASNSKSAQLRALLAARIQMAVDKGFDAVEPDCINGYGDSTGFSITYANQIEFNRWVAQTCHEKGISVCLKSDVDQAADLEPYFDFVLDEESYQYGQLGDYDAYIANGKAVFNCEYQNGGTAWKNFCQQHHINGIRRNVDLTAAGVRDPAIPDTQNTWQGAQTPPAVSTQAATNIGTNTARVNGNLTAVGSTTPVQVSFQYGTAAGQYTLETQSASMSAAGTFNASLTGLAPGTRYYFRTKAVGSSTVYGSELNFTTTAVTPPAVSTQAAASIGAASATLNGNLTTLGSVTPVAVSFQYGTSPGSYTWETPAVNRTATGTFNAVLTGLSPGTKYYFRARAVPSGGTAVYGSELNFTTSYTPPTVNAQAATNLGNTVATVNGQLSALGSISPVNVSFQYGTVSGQYTQETQSAALSGPQSFSSALTGLTAGTTYYFRVKAVAGTQNPAYSTEMSFATTAAPATHTLYFRSSLIGAKLVIGTQQMDPGNYTLPAGIYNYTASAPGYQSVIGITDLRSADVYIDFNGLEVVEMYVVAPGASKVAQYTNNINAGGLTLQQQFFIGTDISHPVVQAAAANFVADGTSRQVSVNINMPSTPGVYKMFIVVTYQSQIVISYVGTQDILVTSGGITDPTLG